MPTSVHQWVSALATACGAIAWTGLSQVVVAREVVALTLSAVVLLAPAARPFMSSSPGILLLSAIGYSAALAVVVVPLLWRWPRDRVVRTLGLAGRWSWRHVSLVPLAFGAYFALSTLAAVVATRLLPWYDAVQTQQIGFRVLSTPLDYIVAAVALIIIAPLAEELLFRGFLYGVLRKEVGVLLSVVLTSALFGFAHGQWNVGIDVAMLSVVLCVLREKTGSVWAGVVLHASKNLLAYVLLFILKVQ